MWNVIADTPPRDTDAVSGGKQIVAYWPPNFPDASRLTVHTLDDLAKMLTLDSPPTMWANLDAIAEDTKPSTKDDKAAALGKLIDQIESGGGDASILKEIAADAAITLPAEKALDADPSQLDSQAVEAPATP